MWWSSGCGAQGTLQSTPTHTPTHPHTTLHFNCSLRRAILQAYCMKPIHLFSVETWQRALICDGTSVLRATTKYTGRRLSKKRAEGGRSGGWWVGSEGGMCIAALCRDDFMTPKTGPGNNLMNKIHQSFQAKSQSVAAKVWCWGKNTSIKVLNLASRDLKCCGFWGEGAGGKLTELWQWKRAHLVQKRLDYEGKEGK